MIAIQNEGYPLEEEALQDLGERIARRIGLKGSATIRLAPEAEVRAANRKFRRRDHVTDVLSFPLGEKLPDGLYAGDVLICVPRAEAQARRQGHSLARELLLLMIHGLLHLKGLDHEADGGEMLARQGRLFAEFSRGVP
ncbi:MAG: rRNA maturation RNase YbeY [Candidatus Aminicenantes bacterium]|nr:rRNA maturation RNase YbeY [Candidatus Aminicenantes bacterium]